MSLNAIALIRRHPIWRDASDNAVRALAQHIRVVPLAAGDAILTGGDLARSIHLLVEGACRVFYPATERSAEITVKLFGAPAAFGDAESIMRTRWAETVEALTPGTVLICDATTYFDIMQREPRVCFRQYWDVARRFGIAIHTERAANTASLVEQVVAIVLAYARQFGKPTARGLLIAHPLTHDDLARQSGSNKRSVVRALTELFASGALERSGRSFLVPSIEKLLAAASVPVPEVAFQSAEKPWAER